MLLLHHFKGVPQNEELSSWLWKSYKLKADYFYEATSTYQQLKALLER